MTRKLFAFSVIALIMISCGTGGKKEAAQTNQEQGAVSVEFASLIANPSEYVGKNISVEGKVVHVCMHSGKKLFITGDNPDVRLYIQAGEEMPKFPTELLGSEVIVEGMLTQPAAGAGETHEAEGALTAAPMHAETGADSCETEKALATQTALADLMMVYAKHTVVK
ncbi:MAG TPA: hypothetical protein DCY25_07010 [Bacteroidales bacterium]|nr:hypothetical protein [Bacteroidales bacterium]